MRTKVLIVDDESSISAFLSTMLEAKGFDTIIAETGKEAIMLFNTWVPDIILLDLGLPDMDGTDVIRYVREDAESVVPIVVVSARMGVSDKVATLDLGVDDYITKPIDTEELAARVRSVLRRSFSCGESRIYQSGGLYVDLEKWTVQLDGKLVDLTPNEMRILRCLIENAGRVVVYDEIIKKVFGTHCGDNSGLRVHVARMRRKLEDDVTMPKYVFTEPGVGFRIADNEYKRKSKE